MDETILDKLSTLSDDNLDYECVLTTEEINNIKNKIELLQEENIKLKIDNIKLEKSNKLIEGLLLIPSKNLETKMEFTKDINNISFLIELRLINSTDNSYTHYIPLFSLISLDNTKYISIGFFNNKLRIDDNFGCLYYSKNECKLDNNWLSIFGIFQISINGINFIFEYNNNKVVLSRFEKNKEQINLLCNIKEWKFVVGYSPIIIKSNELFNIMFKKCIIIQDKLTVDEINNLNYDQIKNCIYINF